eukprot:6260026-Prymnesium_polylepis.2
MAVAHTTAVGAATSARPCMCVEAKELTARDTSTATVSGVAAVDGAFDLPAPHAPLLTKRSPGPRRPGCRDGDAEMWPPIAERPSTVCRTVLVVTNVTLRRPPSWCPCCSAMPSGDASSSS